jgi:zeaxanthin glucosyltransferase
MTHFGAISPTGSHLLSLFVLSRELQQRGHRVTFINILDAQERVLTEHFEFRVIGAAERPLGAEAAIFAHRGTLSGLASLKDSLRTATQDMEIILQEAPKVIRSAGIECLLVDQCSPVGGTVADFLNIPFISLCAALPLNIEIDIPPMFTSWSYKPTWDGRLRNQSGYMLSHFLTKSLRKLVAEYRQKWELPPNLHRNDNFSKLAQLSLQPIEFEFPRVNLPPHFHFTGPYHSSIGRKNTSFPWDRLTGQPLIYASMGTIQNRLLATFQTIAEACQGLDAQLVIALGGGSTPESLPALPGSPLVVGFAPQLELLQRATLTITHAGMNTTLESLSNGVPMVAIPIANDQPGIAARIAWTGTGEVVPLKRLGVSKLRSSIEQVLTEDSYKKNALRLQKAIKQAGGVQRAADIIEQVVATGKPVLQQSR